MNLDKLKKLKELNASGALTDQEYLTEKAKIMAGSDSSENGLARASVEEPWAQGRMVFYSFCSFFLPLIGLVAGIYGWATGRRKQGEKLLMAAFLGCIFWIAVKSWPR